VGRIRFSLVLFFTSVRLVAGPAQGGPGDEQGKKPVTIAGLKRLSLEQLLQMQISTLSRFPQPAFEAPAATAILTTEEIRQSPAMTIPDVIRLAGQVQASQVNAHDWAIGIRGFNTSLTNKLLVLIDGRTVYTPLYAGVWWDAQNTFLPDIDQVEIVRGPGGILWGANAVNGVINIVTKRATDPAAQGLSLYGGGGSTLQAFGGIRYGAPIGRTAGYRVYVKHHQIDDSRTETGADARDAWRFTQGGFRTDWQVSPRHTLTLQGDAYGGMLGQPSSSDITTGGANVLGRWEWDRLDDGSLQLQAYYDYTRRAVPASFTERLGTASVDLQYRISLGDVQTVNAGLGYRIHADHVERLASVAFLPEELTFDVPSGFIQDEIAIIPDRLKLTLGSKFEHNDFSGFEYQPSARVGYVISDWQFAWAAVSRAVRAPSRIDRDFFIFTPTDTLAGGPGFLSEKLISWEGGYRMRIGERTTAGLAVFYNTYDDLRTLEPGEPYVIANGLEARTAGGEITAVVEPTSGLMLKGGWTYLWKEVTLKPWSRDVNRGSGEGNDAAHRLFLNTRFHLFQNLELDAHVRFSSALPNDNARIPAYAELDLRAAWRIPAGVEIAICGQNLLHDRHVEFGAPASRRSVERGVFGMVSWNLGD
jgi:iron complex outermembrane recepter protein